jgi:ribosomal protein S20
MPAVSQHSEKKVLSDEKRMKKYVQRSVSNQSHEVVLQFQWHGNETHKSYVETCISKVHTAEYANIDVEYL